MKVNQNVIYIGASEINSGFKELEHPSCIGIEYFITRIYNFDFVDLQIVDEKVSQINPSIYSQLLSVPIQHIKLIG